MAINRTRDNHMRETAGCTYDEMVEEICRQNLGNPYPVSHQHWTLIARKISEDVATEINEAVPEDRDWTAEDLRIAVGNVLCRKLGIAV